MMRPVWLALLMAVTAGVQTLADAAPRVPDPRAAAEGVLAASGRSAATAVPRTTAATGELRIHFVDVGQGDGMLIISPDGRAILMDAGPTAGGDAMLEVMRREGVEALDLVITSHPHLDHIGGLTRILEAVPVRFYMDPGYAHSSRAYERLLETLERLEIPVRTGRAGRRVNLGGGAVLEILAPDEPLHHGTRSDANANSIVARLTYGSFSVLLTGDAEAPTEAFLLGLPDLRATVLKVAHHGSRHSSDAAFLARVSPEVAVIQVSATNSYGHPAPQTLERLEAAGARIYRNDLHGTVTITSDGASYGVRTERRATAERSSRPEAGAGPGAPRAPPAEVRGP
jgi:competence protein ComEC